MKSNRIMTAIMIIWLVLFSLSIFSCGQKGVPPDTEDDGSTTTAAKSISVSLSQPTVKTDNSDACTISVTVLDKNRVAIPEVDVEFTAPEDSGQLGASMVATDAETGVAETTFKAGPDKENKIVTITVKVDGLNSVPVPIQLVGTVIAVETTKTNLQVGGEDSDTILVTLTDAGDTAIAYETITVKVDGSSSGGGSISCVSEDADCVSEDGVVSTKTDFNGQAEFSVKGTSQGNVTFTADALGATGSANYTVGIQGTSFGISSPSSDPYSLRTGETVTIYVDAPGVSEVQFATSLGFFDGNQRVVDKLVSNDQVSAQFESDSAGIATVQVFDTSNTSTQDSISVVVSAPTSEASQVDVQASPSVVAMSLGDLDNKATLTAIVKNAKDQPVSNAPVAFSIVTSIGGGEKIYPVIAMTDAYGVATTTFTSGSLPSDSGGVEIMAEVLVGSMPTDSTSVKIGGSAGSISLGYGTTIESIDSDTAYKLPMSVIVTDANGNPAQNTKVSLGAWPAQYRQGYWEEIEPGKCVLVASDYPKANEDDTHQDGRRRNLILDEGEDANEDGQLTPMNSAAGELPSTVTTDSEGKASFSLIYLKSYAAWIEVEITASTLVLGDQNVSTYTFWLPYLAGEECPLPNSPYGTDITDGADTGGDTGDTGDTGGDTGDSGDSGDSGE